MNRTQDAGLASTLATNDFLGRTMAFQDALEKKVQTLSVQDVNAALRRVLSLEGLTIVKAGDFKKAGITF